MTEIKLEPVDVQAAEARGTHWSEAVAWHETDAGADAPPAILPVGEAADPPAPASPRFCTRSQNCRMAEGHEGGCQR